MQTRNDVGEKIFAPRAMAKTGEDNHTFRELTAGTTYAYNVTAMCTKNYVPYVSECSDNMEVELISTDIRPATVNPATDGRTEYYSLTGQKLYKGSLPKGVIVVKDGNGTRKVMSR